MRQRTHLPQEAVRTWLVFTEASALASLAVMPYLFALQGDKLRQSNTARIAAGKRPLAPRTIAALAYVQSHITFGVASAAGLYSAQKLGLPPTFIEAWMRGEPQRLPAPAGVSYATAGIGAALAIGALDYTVFNAVRTHLQDTVRTPAPWRGLLASVYGSIAEEVLMRLGAQTILAAGIHRLRQERVTPPSATTMGGAIVLSNLLFGAGHLPAARGVFPLTPLFVTRILLLNGVAGTVFGYLYWRKGLDAAMIAHGAADLTLHVGGAALARHGRQPGP